MGRSISNPVPAHNAGDLRVLGIGWSGLHNHSAIRDVRTDQDPL